MTKIIAGVSNAQANDPQATNVTYPNYVPSAHSAESSNYLMYSAYNLPAQKQILATQQLSYPSSNPPAPVHSYVPHSAYEPPLATHTAYASYVPPTATTQSYASYEPASTQAKSTYGAYDPPVPANRSSYSTYDPPVPKVPFTHPHTAPYNPPTPAYDTPYHKPEQSFSANADGYAAAKSNPQLSTHPGPNTASAAPKSVFTRPKVFNAYDPPFLLLFPLAEQVAWLHFQRNKPTRNIKRLQRPIMGTTRNLRCPSQPVILYTPIFPTTTLIYHIIQPRQMDISWKQTLGSWVAMRNITRISCRPRLIQSPTRRIFHTTKTPRQLIATSRTTSLWALKHKHCFPIMFQRMLPILHKHPMS